ncbi:type VI secretion system-associated protein TagF [Sedimentitalea nanhaiensis]|uniref:Type VI secretion system protein ImpM n=1 Tax=Sedimentitalea nanhaiensis TaxID=999627 RepID=A0A1I7D8Z0_9RHOB|nr:type VI secretion system-associated protein TagF [Sedimentitalea nanhaiensis]SFU08044.1 type VI secretion system protein ImpM [Sedimentitalea nanhaiensis]
MTAGFGAFGKMPSVGDFFRVNPPPGFVSVWDGWIQRAMLMGQSALGADWDAHYMSAPIWRFSLSAGLAGTHKVMGVAMPSVDRVGRRFPLTLMAAVTTPGPSQLDHFSEEPLFEQLEDLALDTLEDGMTRDHLTDRLTAICPPHSRNCAHLATVGSGLVMSGATGGLLPPLAAGLLADRCRQPSIWSAVVEGTHRLLVCDGLPESANMQALFDLDAPIWHKDQPL